MKNASERAAGGRVLGALAGLCALGLATACSVSSAAPHAASTDPEQRCAGCHAADYAAANHPQHAGVKPLECAVCHLQRSWHPSVSNHTWPLTGAHAHAECSECHGKLPGTYAGTDRACVGCHRRDYDDARYPGHDSFALTCQDCHDTRAFKPATHVPPREPEVVPTAEPTALSGKTGKTTSSAKRASAKPTKAKPTTATEPATKPAPAASPTQDLPPKPKPKPKPEPTPTPTPTSRPKPDVTTGASRKR
jgi:hypothetical protein